MTTTLDSLLSTGFLEVKNVLDDADVQTILNAFAWARESSLPSAPVGLNDSHDSTNTTYVSSRSPGLVYCYLDTPEVMTVATSVASVLSDLTGIDWMCNIQRRCVPLFAYERAGVFIQPHRGRDIGFGPNDLVAVAMLSRKDVDFTGGAFFLNHAAHVSADGKIITGETPETRRYFDIPYCGILLFVNTRYVHGTTPVHPGRDGRLSRITVSWRTHLP